MKSLSHNQGPTHLENMDQVKTQLLHCDSAAIEQAAAILRNGQLVAVPTETVYGLAADATNVEAIKSIYSAKGRPTDNPLIVHVGRSLRTVHLLAAKGLISGKQLSSAAQAVADLLIATFWPGPLTLVLPRGALIPDLVSAGLATVALRMPRHPQFLDLLDHTGRPLAAPSANRSNRISPTAARDVWAELAGRIPLILDGGVAEIGVESTVVAVESDGSLRLLRPGGLPLERLEMATGQTVKTDSHVGPQRAPGQSKVHYAPSTPLRLIEAPEEALLGTLSELAQGHQVGLLRFADSTQADLPSLSKIRELAHAIEHLPLDKDGAAAAQGLFAALRRLDSAGLDLIVVTAPPRLATAYWPAIHDRLTRAAAKWR